MVKPPQVIKVVTPGPAGPRGDPGAPGSGQAFQFVYQQNVPATVWGPIAHNLNGFPSVTVVDSSGAPVEVDYHYVDSNTVIVNVGNNPFGGEVYLS